LYHPFLADDPWSGEGTMDGVCFDADDEEGEEEDGECEAGAEYEDEDEDVMDSAIEGENEAGTSSGGTNAKHKPWSKSRPGAKRQRNRSWKDKRVAASDDEFVPHPFGEGVCKEWHFRDGVTEQPYVKVVVEEEDEAGEGRKEETLTLVAGEGIAIGRQPCEFHRNEFGERC